MGPDEILDAIAAACHGLVTRRQLLAAGVSPGAIDRRLANGRLIALYAGVYIVRGHPLTWSAQLAAAILAAGPRAVASHRAAAHLHGLAGLEPFLEITTDVQRAPALAGTVVHRASRLAPTDVEHRDGLARTRVARTLVDLAGVVPVVTVETALDDALSRRLVTCAYLTRRLDDLGRQGRKGAGLLARLLAERSDGRRPPQSAFERRLFALLAAAGLPLPVVQHEVRLPGGRRARLDFAYPQHRLGLEADSYRYHSSRRDWARDHTRNRLLLSLGWRILPVTWDDLATPTELLRAVSRGLCILPPLAG